MASPQTTFRIGPSGWSYPDWEKIVYPAVKPRGFSPLRYIARFFNTVEVNTTFYRIPAAKMTQAWTRLVPQDFRFAVKLTQSFTHQRGEFPARRDFDDFAEGVKPLREAGMLGPLLIQFPWSFRFDRKNANWLLRIGERLRDYQRVIEVRHSSWARPRGLEVIARCGGFCNIDQPRLRDCLEPTAHAGGDWPAYVRLHGRNDSAWFADNIPGYERYNYLYSEAELREWVARIESMATQAHEVYVFANNHYRGQGVANALELRAMLEGGPVAVPDHLPGHYPRLEAVAAPPREPGLFG
ncbi:MAG: DUF72 domain-containing protein [Planctomycetes bacterium]|nr:DUF72 domain-containing protein [Planctomycetota bacterium]